MARDRFFLKAVLDNGVRVVAERMPNVKSASLGVWVEAGSRDEDDRLAGISHFAEHMFFKGTPRRSAEKIAQEIDRLGGELNAFTARETTTFYVKVLDEHLQQAIGLLGDIFHHSLFQPVEIEREKKVVLEEIRMVEDDPEDLIHDLHTQNIWKGNPLGRSILGETGTVMSVTRAKIVEHVRRHYRAERIVIAAAGNFSFGPLVKALNRVFGRSAYGAAAPVHREPPRANGRLLVQRKPLAQAHLCLGMKGLPLTHPDRYGLYALNSILGGSMSSRLFQAVRERKGLVYSIYSHLFGFRDAGLFSVYAAAGPKAVDPVLRLVLLELERLRRGGVTSEELARTLTQMKGAIMLGLESTGSRMSRIAKDEIYHGRYFALKESIRAIEKVTRRQIRGLAEELLDPGQFSLTVLGPVRSVPKAAGALGIG